MTLRRLLLTSAALAATVASIFPTAAGAQERPPLIVKGGLVSSDFGATGGAGAFGGAGGGVGSSGVASFGLGIATRIGLPGRFALQVEALWLRKANNVALERVPGPGLGFFFSAVRLRSDYLELPLLVRYEFPLESTRPYILAGPALALNLSSRLSGPGFDRLLDVGAVEPDLVDQMHDTDVVLALGAGIDFSHDTTRGWVFELRAGWGLTEVLPEISHAGAPTRIAAHHRSFLAMVGFRF